MKKILGSLVFALLALGAFPAKTLENERIVVSFPFSESVQVHNVDASSAAAVGYSEYCIELDPQSHWCIPKPNTVNRVRLFNTEQQAQHYTSRVLRVPDGLSLDDAVQALQSTGFYSHVEPDFRVYSHSWNEGIPNDFQQADQHYFLDNSIDRRDGASIFSLWNKIQNPDKTIDLYILDVSFRLHEDIQWQDGFNFTVIEYDSERRPGFLEDEFNEECEGEHGLHVASVIGAEINNDKNIAGVAGDVRLHPLRVMNCNSGWSTDTAAALNWLAGVDSILQESPNLPPFTGQPGIVNMSLGARILGDCPFYYQNAIDRLVEQGFTLVVSAGNDNQDVSGYAPANCNHVITVGATTSSKDGGAFDKAAYSNYGELIDIMAVGATAVLTNKVPDAYQTVSGTSVSTPLVSGILALVQKDFAFTPMEWKQLVRVSGLNAFEQNSDCFFLGCGGGVLDGVKLYQNAVRYSEGRLDYAEFALQGVRECQRDFVIKYMSDTIHACNLITLNILSKYLGGDYYIELYKTPDPSTPDHFAWIGNSYRNKVNVDYHDFKGNHLMFRKCTLSGDCQAEYHQINLELLDEVPVSCQ